MLLFKLNRKLAMALVGAALVLTLGVIESFHAFHQLQAAAASRRYTFVAISAAGDWLSNLKDAETGQRGYLLTGDEAFLQPYAAVHAELSQELTELRQATASAAAQQHLAAVVPLLAAKQADMAAIIVLRRQPDMPAVLLAVSSGHGKELMDAIRAEMQEYLQLQSVTLQQYDDDFQAALRLLFIIMLVASTLALGSSLLIGTLMLRAAQQRVRDMRHAETEHLLALREEANGQLLLANTTLQRSEENLAVTLSSIGDAVIATDAAGCVTRLNPRAEQLTGWPLAEAAGRPVADVFHIINETTRLAATIPVALTLAQGTVHGLANHTVLIARDGSECAIADSCAPIRARDGQIIGAVLVFRDVTQEYAAQQALRDQQFYTRSLIESSLDGLMTINPAGVIMDVNQQMQALAGGVGAELIGAPFRDCFTDAARASAGIAQVLRDGHMADYELVARARDGRETPVSFNATTFYDRQQQLQGVFAAARDVTERQQVDRVLHAQNLELEQARLVAERANLAKSDFLASMSHELRTPLNAILGFAQLMETDVPEPTSAQRESLAQILQAGWHLLNLINEVLDLAVIESGKVSLSREAVALAEVLAECQAMVAPQAQQAGISLHVAPLTTLLYVTADRTRLKQIITNLLSNAIKYNRVHGTVTVTCTPGSSATTAGAARTRICVRDTGAGLAPAQLAQLFQPFNRLGQEAGQVAGTGIGLVVIKRLAEVMGGAIGVASTVGTGSEFWCDLPACPAPQLEVALADVAGLATPGAAHGAAPRTVLYVEDNPANMKLVEHLLSRYPNLRLLTAVNATLGLAAAREQQPAVILMDINLPGISGVQALTALRADPRTAHIPVVAISANAMPRDIEHGLAAGFCRYLTKPIKVKEFMETLTMALDQAKEHTP